MKLLIPPDISSQLVKVLRKAGKREVGGILMGEHIGPDTFRVKELTVQRKYGTFASFVRIVDEITAPLKAFFDSTKHNYTRFNYLGEWHSHHSFSLSPSGEDHDSMRELIYDSQLGARFIILLLVKLNEGCCLESSVTVYQPDSAPKVGVVSYSRPNSDE
jgi:hypothetical protein